MKLSDAKIRTATAQDKAYKLSDGNGLYLLVTKPARNCGGWITRSIKSAIPIRWGHIRWFRFKTLEINCWRQKKGSTKGLT